MHYGKLWLGLGLVVISSFAVLGYFGREIYRQAPPVPSRVVTSDGKVLFTGEAIKDGQNAWQSMGGQEVGSVWGHGAYVAPDWSADWLHREASLLRERIAREDKGAAFDALNVADRAAVLATLREEMRSNSYDAKSGTLTLSTRRAAVVRAVASHYDALFSGDA